MGFIVKTTTDQTIDPKYLTLCNHVHVTSVSLILACLQLFSWGSSGLLRLMRGYDSVDLVLVLVLCIPPVMTIVGITKRNHACLIPTLILTALSCLVVVILGIGTIIGFIVDLFNGNLNEGRFHMLSETSWTVMTSSCVLALLIYGLLLFILAWRMKVEYMSFKFIKEKQRSAAHPVQTIYA